ncbi:MAG: thermonuclease family protein [Nitrososphaeria archaeon]|nr:thermonuclease family protein [Nitrososphaeria archaeon]
MRSLMLVLLFCGLFSIYIIMPSYAAGNVEIDSCAQIYHVVDGDTFDAFPVGRVRLADVNAPEIDTPEGKAARDVLIDLFEEYGPRIYLDVDDVHVMDRYNRIVAVGYLRYNSTHLMNINKWLLENGHAVVSNYDNEFNPDWWSLYLYHPGDPCRGLEISISTITTTSMITSTITITVSTTFTQTMISAATTTIERGGGISIQELIIAMAMIFALVVTTLIIAVRYARRKTIS